MWGHIWIFNFNPIIESLSLSPSPLLPSLSTLVPLVLVLLKCCETKVASGPPLVTLGFSFSSLLNHLQLSICFVTPPVILQKFPSLTSLEKLPHHPFLLRKCLHQNKEQTKKQEIGSYIKEDPAQKRNKKQSPEWWREIPEGWHIGSKDLPVRNEAKGCDTRKKAHMLPDVL